MFYSVVVNDWGETTYVPTTLGSVLLIVVIAMLLALATVMARSFTSRLKAAKNESDGESADAPSDADKKSSMGKLTAKQLAFCAMALALGTILSNIKLLEMPTGGSITLLSMLVICLPGFLYGPAAGFLTCTAYGVLQLVIDPYVLYPMQLVVDYILAFGSMGVSGFFSKSKNGLIKGYLAAVTARFVFAVISGWIFFGEYAWDGWSALPYSLAYNAVYIYAEAAITIIILLIPAVRKAISKVVTMARE